MTEKDMLITYVQSREAVNNLKDQLKDAQYSLIQAESNLVNMLNDKGAQSTAKYEDIGKVTLKEPRIYASYLKENEDSVFDYLKTNGLSYFIKPTVHASTLSSYVKSLVSEGKEVPEIFNYYLKPQVSYYKGV